MDQPGPTSAALIDPFAMAHASSRLVNLPPPIFFSMMSQTMAAARDQSSSDGSSGVAIVASEFSVIANGHEDGETAAQRRAWPCQCRWRSR